MNTVDSPRRANTFKVYLIGPGLFGLFELLALFVAVGAGQSYEDSLNWFTSANITAAVIAIAVVLFYKHSKRAGATRQPKRYGWALTIMWPVLLFGTFLGWHLAVFPWMVSTALRHDGVSTAAVITKAAYYQFQGHGRGGSYYPVDSLDQADSVRISITYNGHSSTIFVHKDDADFWPVYSDLQTSGRQVSVRYLRQLPGIVRLATEGSQL